MTYDNNVPIFCFYLKLSLIHKYISDSYFTSFLKSEGLIIGKIALCKNVRLNNINRIPLLVDNDNEFMVVINSLGIVMSLPSIYLLISNILKMQLTLALPTSPSIPSMKILKLEIAIIRLFCMSNRCSMLMSKLKTASLGIFILSR